MTTSSSAAGSRPARSPVPEPLQLARGLRLTLGARAPYPSRQILDRHAVQNYRHAHAIPAQRRKGGSGRSLRWRRFDVIALVGGRPAGVAGRRHRRGEGLGEEVDTMQLCLRWTRRSMAFRAADSRPARSHSGTFRSMMEHPSSWPGPIESVPRRIGGFRRHLNDPLRIGFTVDGAKVNGRGFLHAGTIAAIAGRSPSGTHSPR